jgi:hypothetical protein
MLIRAAIPLSCWVTGATADELSPSFRFTSRNCVVTGSLDGEDPVALPKPGSEDPWYRKVHSLSVEIDELTTDFVTRVVTSDDPERVVGLLLKPVNRIIRSIRNFGLVTHIREYRTDEFASDRGLNLLSAEVSADGVTWTRVREPPNDLAELLASRLLIHREDLGQFKVTNLAEVQEAIEDNLTAGPERTFLANALEYLRRGDLRVAVVESIICLEILIGQLLPEMLKASSISADALTKDITLYPRVKMLLPLLLPKEMADVDLEVVLRTITLRNKIVHEGYLPEGIPEGTVRQGIGAVVSLAHNLAHKRDALKRGPGLQGLSQRIATQFDVRAPEIKWNLRHMFTVTFPFFFDPMPPMDRLAEVSDAVVDGLKQIDSRCQPNTDVFIFFLRCGTQVATWQGGRFIVIPGPPPDPFAPRGAG